MAYRKQCDYEKCRAMLGVKDVPFIQIHGSISEQREDGNGAVQYRYLTEHVNSKLAFCNDNCFKDWVVSRGTKRPFVQRLLRA